jgi:hypothetical protein
VPTASDDAVIDNSFASVTIAHPGTNSDSVNSLNSQAAIDINGGTLSIAGASTSDNPSGASTINNGLNLTSTLTVSGNLSVNGSFTWRRGTLNGSGTLDAYGGMAVSQSSSYLDLGGVTINNHAAATWTGTGTIRGSGGAAINNLAGATFDVQADAQFLWDSTQPGPYPVFNNAGSFTRSGDANETNIDIPFNNAGTVAVQAGYLHLVVEDYAALSTSGGSFTGAAGTTLKLTGEDLTASSVVAGDTVILVGVTEAGSYQAVSGTAASNVTFTGPILGVGSSLGIGVEGPSTVSFSPASGGPVTLTTGTLTVEPGATLTGTDSFTTTGMFTVSDGSRLSGPFTVDACGGMLLDTSSYVLHLDGVTINNHATATWTGHPGIYGSGGAAINNLAGATFNAQADAQFLWDTSQPGPIPMLSNAGTFIRSGDAGMTDIQITFNNTGTVDVQDGTLAVGSGLGGSTTNAGTIAVSAGATLYSGGFTQTGGATVLNGGAIVNGPFIINGGTLTGSGTINGNVTNAGQVIPGGTGAAGTLTINGNYTQTASGALNVELGGTAAGGQYDQLAVSGTAALGGTLNVTPIHGFAPTLGNTFQVLNFGSASNNFATDNGLALGGGLFLDRVFNASNLTLDADQVAISGAPAFGVAGLPITLTSSVTGPSAGNTFAFSWTVTQNGSPFSSGTGSPFSFTPTVNGTYVVGLTVSDAAGGKGAASVQVSVGPSIFVLDPSAGGALNLSGNASIKIAGAVVIDSSSSSALAASGNTKITASVIDVNGGVQKSGNATFSPAPTTAVAPLPDLLAALPAPSTSGLTSYGSVSLAGNSSKTISPGIYSQITVSGNAKLTLSSGIYIIEGGGFTVSGNASVTGSGVMICNAGSQYPSPGGNYGSITFSGNGSFTLSPPTSGTYAGVVLFQARDNARALNFSGNTSAMTGTIYAPSAQLVESGSAQLSKASLIVDLLTMSGNVVMNAHLQPPAGTVAYTPAQIRAAYGINNLALDGTGQTIAIVAAYDDPNIYPAVDAFDSQFGLTASGATLYQQYGPATTFLTVLNQDGQATSLPTTDGAGPGPDNWEQEESLDVEWLHAMAPGAQIILVEANSDSLADLMAGVATAAGQPGVSVVSMSWGFAEGQDVLASDEATYDSVFNVPGVTFVASSGDAGGSAPEYPAFSPNVVAVGGTSLTLNADNSYNSETGWGYYSDTLGTFIGSGGGISQFEAEPAYQQGVQSLGNRTTPDVPLVADPATGAWIADLYNLPAANPFEVVGGTSLSAPAWAGLLALANQGRIAAGETTLNSASPTDTQQALYMLPQADYHVISSGNNGYAANPGYNLVTGLGTPVADLLVPDLVAYQGSGTSYPGPTVGPLQDATFVDPGAGSGGGSDAISAFESFVVTSHGLGYGQDPGQGSVLTSAMGEMETMGVAHRTVPLQDLGIPDGPASADPLTAAGLDRLTPAVLDPVAGGSGIAVDEGTGGTMPLDDVVARDAILTNWSSPRTLATKRMPAQRGRASGSSFSGGIFAVLGGARRSVLQARLVDAVLSDGGKPRSLDTGARIPG